MQFKHLFLMLTLLLNFLLAGFAQEPTLLEHGGGLRTVEFSPVNSQIVASAGESNTIKLWNLKNGSVRMLKGHTDFINSIAFSPNGRLLASVSDDRTIKLWNVHNQQNIATLREGTQFRTVAFSPDGEFLATGGWLHVKLWDVGRRTEIATLQHDQYVQTVAFSEDGEFLAVGDAKEDSGTVKVWNIQEQRAIATLKDDLVVVRSVTFSSDDQYLASSHYNGDIKVWDVLTWELLRIIPGGDYDIAFSPDGKVIVGTRDRSVNLWWVEDGTNVAQLPGPTGWMHPVDFSYDGTSLAVGGEDGIVRVWHINTSLADGKGDGVRILHIDTYFQQLPKANSANGNNIPEPVPPPALVRDFYELDPYYEQWINVGGLPVIASANVNPYALKEAAWLIEKMIGHRPEVLRSMVKNKARFSVIPYTEIITEIPEYHSNPTPDFLVSRYRGGGGSEGATVTSSEENILSYPNGGTYNVLIHEFAHGIHLLGLNTLDPTFEERLRIAYEAAMKKGLWQGTYASRDIREYWAEATQAWFQHNAPGSFDRFGNTRHELKEYDPELATLLADVYGDREWRYTPVATRTHQPHLQGFNPKNSPTFQGWPELEAFYRQLRDPNSDGGDGWVNLKPYSPDQLSRLTKPLGDTSMWVVFVNFTQDDVFYFHQKDETWYKIPSGFVRYEQSKINQIWLVKDSNERNIAVFQAKEKTGRAAIGVAADETNPAPQEVVRGDVNKDSKVNAADLSIVVDALGKKAGAEPSADINADGNINVDDLLLVIEHLDDPVNAASPALNDIRSTMPASQLQVHLNALRAESDGSLKYWRAIALFEYLIIAARPNQTVLLANYPNPFNPETWIPYQLAEPADVTVSIYAADGRLVRTLDLGHQSVGIYESRSRAAYWDGRNELGEPMASGVYFFTLTADDFTATRKMLILK